MGIARATGHIPSVKNGEDAVSYEIVPSTLVVSLDANGNWVDGTVTSQKGAAVVILKAVKITGSNREEFTGYWEDGEQEGGVSKERIALIKKTDSERTVLLYNAKIDGNNEATKGELLSVITISVNRAGANGSSILIQYSADGSTDWKDSYFIGAKYIRIYANGSWGGAMKLVGDDGTSFLIKGSFTSKEELPTSGTKLGDAYLINGDLWVYVAYTGDDTTKHYRGFENIGNIKGPKGDSITVASTKVYYGISASGTDYNTVAEWIEGQVQNVTSDKPYLWTKSETVFSDGKSAISYSVTTRGNKGATPRQHIGFESGEYDYQSGSGTEEFIDVIANNGAWYWCVQSYNSKTNPELNSLTSKAWKLSSANQRFIATDFMLANNATINMLGSNEINLYSSNSTMFGSFRVPHGDAGVAGDKDGGTYALWLGADIGANAPFSVTKNGEMKAYSGVIGGLNIYNISDGKKGFYYYRKGTDNYPESKMSITSDSLLIGAQGGVASLYGGNVEICPWGGGRKFDNGNTSWDFSQSALTVRKNLVNSPIAMDSMAAYVTSTGCDGKLNEGFVCEAENGNEVIAMRASAKSGTTNIGLLVSAAGGTTNEAIRALNGVYAGLRLPVVTKFGDFTIGEYETIIIFNTESSTKNIVLPSNPSQGELHIIVQNGSASYNISTNDGSKLYGRGNDNGTPKLNVDSRNSWLMLFYVGAGWNYKQIN